MTETDIMRQIMVDCSNEAILFRANVGQFFTKKGTPIRTGLPVGFSDLFGFRLSDNKIVFIEVKTNSGKASKDQKRFLATVKKYGCLCGIAKNSDDAKKIIRGETKDAD